MTENKKTKIPYDMDMKNYFYVIFGSLIFAFSVAQFALPAGLVSGGVSGIGILVKELSGNIPIALTGFVLNVPLFIISFKERGRRFFTISLTAFLSLTVFLWIFEELPLFFKWENDLFAFSLLYGTVAGIGLGIILKMGATSGGTDMFASIIKRRKPHLKISFLIMVIDVVVILAGALVFGVVKALYATLALFISVRVIDMVLSGAKVAKAVFIVTEKEKEIAGRIIQELERGVTGINAEGLYTNKKQKLIFSVVSATELAKLHTIVYESDNKAFVTVTDARQVLGKGFDDLNIVTESLK